MRFSVQTFFSSAGPGALARRFFFALSLTGLLAAAPAHAQEGAAELITAIKSRAASAVAPAASDAAPPPADAKLVQRATRATQQDDERMLADITARLSRNPAFAGVQPTVQAGVAQLTGHVPDNEARQLAAKIVGAKLA